MKNFKILFLSTCLFLIKFDSRAITISQDVFSSNSGFWQNEYNDGNGSETFADAEDGGSCYTIYSAKLESITTDLGGALLACLAFFEMPIIGTACMVFAYKSAADKRAVATAEFEDCINNQKH